MTRFYFIFISSLILFFNTNLLGEESEKLKIGLLAPFSGEYENLGNSLLLSSQLALNEIGDKNIIIVPRDSGSDDKKKLNESIKDLINQEIKIIVGPIQSNYFNELEKYKNTIFISLSNKYPEIRSNVISIGIRTMNAAPKNAPEMLPKPPMITMNKISNEIFMSKTSTSAAPKYVNTYNAPATPA